MTTFRQIEANRRNALRSTGPRTEEGKRRSRLNAARHGLTAETVVQNLEDAEDYKAFEATIIADYGAETAVARELVLRLASLLWRLRRATAIETDLFTTGTGSSVEHGVDVMPSPTKETSGCALLPFSGVCADSIRSYRTVDGVEDWAFEEGSGERAWRTRVLSNAFLRLAKLDSGAFQRLNRYEAALWRQAIQIIWVLKPIRLR
jgi:hypothetical protein